MGWKLSLSPERGSGAPSSSWLLFAGCWWGALCTTQRSSWKQPGSLERLPTIPASPLLSSQPHSQPEWQHRLWPLPVPRAGGQWSILVCRVAGSLGTEKEESLALPLRLDGEGHQGALWDRRDEKASVLHFQQTISQGPYHWEGECVWGFLGGVGPGSWAVKIPGH